MSGRQKFFAGIVLATLLLAACGNRDGRKQWQGIGDRYVPDPDVPAWTLDTRKDRVTLTWFVQAEWWNASFGEDFVTSRIAKDMNIDIDFRIGDESVLATVFASGTLPDIITIFDAASVAARGAASWAQPLNQLAESYDPYFFKVASPDTLNWYKMDDGNTYGYSDYSNTFADYENDLIPAATAFLIRRDVYDAIGRLPMRTPEEFKYAISVIAQRFPNLRPFATGAKEGQLIGTFQDLLGVPIETEDGKFYDRNLDPDYLAWIRTFSELHRDGYIDDDRFSWSLPVYEEMVRSGSFATILPPRLPNMAGNLQIWMTANPGMEYIAIDGPASTLGRQPALSQSGISGWMINYITKQAVDPAVAIQLFTYLLSDYGQILTFFGVEGETFERLPDGKISFLPWVTDIRNNDNNRFVRELRFREFIPFGHDRTSFMDPDALLEAVKQPIEWGRGKLVPQFVIENIDPDPGTPQAMSLVQIKNEWDRTIVGLVRAASDAEFDATLESYKAFQARNNWNAIVDIFSANMARNREKLGIN